MMTFYDICNLTSLGGCPTRPTPLRRHLAYTLHAGSVWRRASPGFFSWLSIVFAREGPAPQVPWPCCVNKEMHHKALQCLPEVSMLLQHRRSDPVIDVLCGKWSVAVRPVFSCSACLMAIMAEPSTRPLITFTSTHMFLTTASKMCKSALCGGRALPFPMLRSAQLCTGVCCSI